MSQLSAKIDLHNRFKKHAFEHALIITYNFGARFFEDYALDNFKALQDNGNISILIDAIQYKKLLNAATDSSESFLKKANLRYLLHPVQVRGAFHPKVFLFADKHRGLLLIGSANLTQDGLGSNAELVTAFDYEEGKNEAALPLFQSALRFFEQVAVRWPGEQLDSNLGEFIADVPWISKTLVQAPDPELPTFLSNLESPLWDQLVARLPKPVQHISILSRFFDAQPSLVEHVRQTTGTSRLTLYTQNRITTLTDAWLRMPAFVSGDLQIQLCKYVDKNHAQQLHAKAYIFDCGKQVVFAIGSANFTTPAIRLTANNGNLEVLLCYPPVPARQISPKTWFDPESTGIKLKSADQLVTASENPDEHDEEPNKFSLRLTEALVEDDALIMKTTGGDVSSVVMCLISQGNMKPFILRVAPAEAEILRASLDPAQQKWLRNTPAIAQLGTGSLGNWMALSNQLLVTNLQDIVTGSDLRRERQIREARESPQRFIDVLTALSRDDNEERLKQFLTYCDIPIDLPVRLFQRRHSSTKTADGQLEALRVLGERNLKHFEILHDAVMDFVHRHRRRLDHHIERGTAKQIPNFLHILLTIGNLLLSQIERVRAALEVGTTVQMDPYRWHQIRDNLDIYYCALRELLQLTAVNYLDAMIEAAPIKNIRAEFSDSLSEIMGLYNRAIKDRDSLDALQGSHLRIVTLLHSVSGPGFFDSVLAPQKWKRYLASIRSLQAQLSKRLTA